MKIYLDGCRYGRTAEKITVYLPEELAQGLYDWMDLSDDGDDFKGIIGNAIKKYVAKHKDAIEEYRTFTAKFRKADAK